MSTIRPMISGDIEAVGQVWLAASLVAHDFVDAAFWHSDLETMTTEILPHPRTRGYVWDADGVIEGFVTLGGDFLACLFVRPDCQGTGIGSALLEHVKGLHERLSLTVYRQNVAATRFYERRGFRIVGESTCEHTGCAESRMEWSREA